MNTLNPQSTGSSTTGNLLRSHSRVLQLNRFDLVLIFRESYLVQISSLAIDVVVFAYGTGDDSGRLSQGEILWGVTEPIFVFPEGQKALEQQGFSVELTLHDKILIVTADCDLFSDFYFRFDGGTEDESQQRDGEPKPQLLDHVVCCEVYDEVEARQALPKGNERWRRVTTNQEQRYHYIPKGALEGQTDGDLLEYFIDFKKVFTLPTSWLYGSISSREVQRRGVIPEPWIQSIIQRLFAYQGRVSLPDPFDHRKLPKRLELLNFSPIPRLSDTSTG